MAHAATLAANQWKITNETYIIVLAVDDISEFIWDRVDHEEIKPNDYVLFQEPDLDYRTTAVASLNPPPHFYKHLKLWKGGETNGN